MPVTEVPKAPEPLCRHGIYSAVGLGGLKDKSGGLFDAGGVVGEKGLDILESVQLREHIWSGHMGNMLKGYTGPRPAGGVGGEGYRAKCHSVKGPHQGEYTRAALHLPGKLQRGLHGVGAGGAGELELVMQAPGL